METSRGWAGWQSFNLDFLAEAVGIRRGQLAAEPVATRIDELLARLYTYDLDWAEVRG
jgi:hypothetical protein